MRKLLGVMTACLVASTSVGFSRPARAADAPPAPAAPAAESYAANQSMSVGFSLHRFQDDFGLGAKVGSPTFAGDRMRLTLGGGVAFYPYALKANALNAQVEQDWAHYGHVRVLFEGGMRAPGSPVRLYGFGGPILCVLTDRLSESTLAFGGIGGFGFEYYFVSGDRDGPVSYFVELGGVGTSAKADKLATKPTIGTGFNIAVGFHWYL